MTKNTEVKEKTVKRKKTRRNNAKYPALEKKYTLSMRQDYLDVEYVNGVYDKDGNEVIRPLTDEEKVWLNKFYEEELNANFNYDKRMWIINKKLQPLKKKFKSGKMTKKEVKEYEKLQKEYFDLAEKICLNKTQEEMRFQYRENNRRNDDIWNRQKASGKLTEIDDCTYNYVHNNVYYCACSGENLLINQVQRKQKIQILKDEDLSKE